MKYVVNQLDPILADRIVTDTSQGSTLEQAVRNLAEQMQALQQIVAENREYITAEIEEDQARDGEENFKKQVINEIRANGNGQLQTNQA
jgi:predicted RNase H-like HicB family nuclease